MNKVQNKTRYGGIDVFKHLLAIFVILHHMISTSRYSVETNLFITNLIQYVNGAVIGFILISGFFFNFRGSLKDGVFKIFKRTMVPFFLFSIIYTFFLFLLGKQSLFEGFYKTLNLKGASMQLYYLSFLFVIYTFYLIVFHFFSISKLYLKYILIFIMIVFAILSMMYPTESATGSDYKLFFIYALSFGISVYLSIFRKEDERLFLINTSIIVVLCLLLGMIDFRFLHISAMIILLILFYYLSCGISFFNRQIPGSGGVYLLHTPLINFGISSILISLGYVEKQNLFLTLIFTYSLTLIITLIFIKIFPKQKFILLE